MERSLVPFQQLFFSNIIRDYDLFDVWREYHPLARQYTWVKASSDRISSARLDRCYISRSKNNKVQKSVISPNGFTDHQLCSFEISLKKSKSLFLLAF